MRFLLFLFLTLNIKLYSSPWLDVKDEHLIYKINHLSSFVKNFDMNFLIPIINVINYLDTIPNKSSKGCIFFKESLLKELTELKYISSSSLNFLIMMEDTFKIGDKEFIQIKQILPCKVCFMKIYI